MSRDDPGSSVGLRDDERVYTAGEAQRGVLEPMQGEEASWHHAWGGGNCDKT